MRGAWVQSPSLYKRKTKEIQRKLCQQMRLCKMDRYDQLKIIQGYTRTYLGSVETWTREEGKRELACVGDVKNFFYNFEFV